MTLPPGPRLPTLAQTLDWVYRPARFMQRCQARYGDYFTVRLLGLSASGSARVVFICDPSAVKTIFTADPALAPAGAGREAMEPMFGARSVLLIDGQAHMRQRKLMLPPFHGERLSRYGALMGEIAREEIARWPERRAFALQARMQAITLEIILRVVFGLEEDERRAVVRTHIQRLLDIVANPLTELFAGLPERIGPINLRGQFLRTLREADAVLLGEIARRRSEPNLENRDDILSLLLQARDEDGEVMSDAELRDQLVTLLLAGHETTATALAWAFDQMLRAPDTLDRAISDVQQHLTSDGGSIQSAVEVMCDDELVKSLYAGREECAMRARGAVPQSFEVSKADRREAEAQDLCKSYGMPLEQARQQVHAYYQQ